MKFQCDRCKTRYSIADERVHGKILKIRCKNCSAVITVREGMDAAPVAAAAPAAAVAGGGSALQGAFQAVMARPQPAAPIDPGDSFRAPVHIAEEWYLSVDGEQEGPFGLATAKEWVLSRPTGEEIYCWQ
ncbi:MAG TPA: zinc-ribbon domain-containing protein, partial [Kofleriaceae bacterium]|nr:zinc-ribbon domain-containing protein [Kofleriaceae bacterium]